VVAIDGRRTRRRPPKCPLTLEALEDRALPSVTIFTGANSLHDNNWSDPLNWSNGVPRPSDAAEFNTSSAETQFSTVDGVFTIEGLLMTTGAGAASIFINASLVLTGSSELDGGILYINGQNGGAVTNNGTLTSANSVGLHGTGTFTNNGTIIRLGTCADGDLTVGGFVNGQGLSVKLDNTASGVIDLMGDSGFTSGNGYIANEGTIEKTAGTGTSEVFVSVQNTGTIDAGSGTIKFVGVGSNDTGTPFGTVDTNGTFKTAAGAFIDLAEAGFLSFVEKGTFTATGSGTILLDAGGELDAGPAGATFNIARTATFQESDNAEISVPAMTTLTFNGSLSLNTGTFHVTIGGEGTFIENGTITVSGAGDLALTDTTLDISSGSTFNLQSDAGIFINGGLGMDLITNAGTIEKTGGTGTSSISIDRMNNTGTIDAETGTLALAPSTGTDTNGTFKTAAGAVIDLAQFFDRTITENGTFTATGSGTFLVDAGTVKSGPAGSTFNIARTVTFQEINDAEISIPAMTTLTFNGSLSLDTGSHKVSLGGPGTFIENGTITESGSATGDLALDNNINLVISSGSTFNFQSDSGIFTNVGSGMELITNAGTIEKTGGTGTSTIGNATMNNNGTIAVSTGTLAVNVNTFTNSGNLVVAPGSVLQVGSGVAFAQTTTASFQPILAGPTSFGQLQVSNNIPLAGALSVSTAGNFTPSAGQSFPVLTTSGSTSGRFSRLSGLLFPNRTVLNPVYSSSGVTLETVSFPPLAPPAQLGQVANGLTHSQEHYADFVTHAYLTYLGRSTTPTELSAWVNAMEGGLTDEHVGAFFIGSPEYIANHGGAGWVRGLYQDLLGRTPTDAEVNAWVQALNSGVAPQTIAFDFAASTERETIRVEGDYQTFLGRTPSQAELSGWDSAFANGLTNESLVAGFLASPEYYNSSAKGNSDNLDWIKSAIHDEFRDEVPPRSATAVEISTLEAALMPANLSQVANQLTHASEYYANFVTNAYETYLGRSPDQIDPTDVSAWVNAMQNGLSDEQLEAQFIGSAEYIANHGGSGAGFVRGLYQDLLGRTPTDAEVNAWVQTLNNGVSPQTIAYDFTASAEREAIRVRDDYFRYLGRAASQTELEGWVNAFTHGLTNENLVAGFLASPEYYNSLAKGGSNKAGWVESAFLDGLGRAPSSAEFETWGGALQ
jgi:hypothetical protein